MSEWVKIKLVKCDLCSRVAKFSHPAGGLRCDECPKPEEDNVVCDGCGHSAMSLSRIVHSDWCNRKPPRSYDSLRAERERLGRNNPRRD